MFNKIILTLLLGLTISLPCHAVDSGLSEIQEVFAEFESAIRAGSAQRVDAIHEENVLTINESGTYHYSPREKTSRWIAGEGWKNRVSFKIKNVTFLQNKGVPKAVVEVQRVTGVDKYDFIYVLQKREGKWRIICAMY